MHKTLLLVSYYYCYSYIMKDSFYCKLFVTFSTFLLKSWIVVFCSEIWLLRVCSTYIHNNLVSAFPTSSYVHLAIAMPVGTRPCTSTKWLSLPSCSVFFSFSSDCIFCNNNNIVIVWTQFANHKWSFDQIPDSWIARNPIGKVIWCVHAVYVTWLQAQ